MGLLNLASNIFYLVIALILDLFRTLGNFIRPSLPVGQVTPEGQPGYAGNWPKYQAPRKGDSRSACPGLNALANHGIIPRDGKGLKFTDVSQHVDATYNLSPTLSQAICIVAAIILDKRYSTDTFDLEEVSLHNGIEHDASLTRLDTALQPNQAVPQSSLIKELFSFASGKDVTKNPILTLNDLSLISGKRRAESKAANKAYSLSFFHKLFGSANAAFLSLIFGGQVDDLHVVLSDEQLPQGWESRFRQYYGLTISTLNPTAILVELGILKAGSFTVDSERAFSAEK